MPPLPAHNNLLSLPIITIIILVLGSSVISLVHFSLTVPPFFYSCYYYCYWYYCLLVSIMTPTVLPSTVASLSSPSITLLLVLVRWFVFDLNVVTELALEDVARIPHQVFLASRQEGNKWYVRS